jgi:hypothetical protein
LHNELLGKDQKLAQSRLQPSNRPFIFKRLREKDFLG